MPDFSIVIPVLNGASFIERSINSVLSQNVDVQLMVFDGGSTDETVNIVRSFGSQIHHFESGPDGGQAAAINKGLLLAKGTWFNWLNADDELMPGALSKVAALTDSHADVVTGLCRHVDPFGNELAIGGTVTQGSIELTMANYSMGQPAHFYRTSVLHSPMRLLNEHLHFCMDMDLWFRYLIDNGCEFVTQIPSVLANFTVHPSSKTVAMSNAMKAEKYALFCSVAESCGVSQLLPELAERASDFRKKYDILDSFEFQTDVFVGHLAWHLLLEANEKDDLKRARELFNLCCKGGRITYGETIRWNFRLFRNVVKYETNCRFQ